jgi:hypothetical protein
MSDYGAYLEGRDIYKESKPMWCYGLARMMNTAVTGKTGSGEVETPENYFADWFGVMKGNLLEEITLKFDRDLSGY